MEELKELKELIKQKVNADITKSIETDKEFYYTAGQCINFMSGRYVSVNKLLNKNLVSKPVLAVKTVENLKKQLRMLFGKCSNMLYKEDRKFNNAYAMVIGYVPDSNVVDKDTLQIGYLEKCILF